MARKKRARKQEVMSEESEEEAKELACQKRKAAEDRKALAQCKCGKPEDFEPIVFDVASYPEQMLRARYAKIKNINICSSWLDAKAKQFVYDSTPNGIDIERITVSFDDIAKQFGWKGIEISDNLQTVYPVC